MSAPAIIVRRLVGRCADGAERDGGSLWHAIDQGPGRGWVALCGARPGRRSAGWSAYAGERVTCPRCLRKLAAVEAAGPAPAPRPPGSFRCPGGDGHDDPDNSGLCIRCGGVADGGDLGP